MPHEYWVAVRTKGRKELYVSQNIQNQGLVCYYPRILGALKSSRERSNGPVPTEALFPGYVFARTPGQWRFLLSTFGVVGVVLVGNEPAVVPPNVIDELKSREGLDGLVKLPTPVRDIRKGAGVRITGGAFKGMAGIYEGQSAHSRVEVLLEILGRKTPVTIEDTFVEEL